MWLFILPLFLWALYFAKDNKEALKDTVPYTLQYLLLAFIVQLIASADLSIKGADRSLNIDLLLINTWGIGRDYFLGSVGLVLLSRHESISPLRDWENIFSYFNTRNILWIVGVTITYSVYVLAMIYLFNNQLKSSLNEAQAYSFTTMLFMSIVSAIKEELLIRLFIIGFITYILKDTKQRWIIAVILSSLFWTGMHFEISPWSLERFAQLFPIGVVLGYSLKKHGFESCVFIHILTNALNLTIMRLLYSV
jgi:hypothetical protein